MAQWTSSASRTDGEDILASRMLMSTMDILSVQDADEHNGQMAGSRATSSVSRTDGEDILSVEEWMQWRTRSMATSSASRTDNKVDGDILSVHSSASSSLGVQDR